MHLDPTWPWIPHRCQPSCKSLTSLNRRAPLAHAGRGLSRTRIYTQLHKTGGFPKGAPPRTATRGRVALNPWRWRASARTHRARPAGVPTKPSPARGEHPWWQPGPRPAFGEERAEEPCAPRSQRAAAAGGRAGAQTRAPKGGARAGFPAAERRSCKLRYLPARAPDPLSPEIKEAHQVL